MPIPHMRGLVFAFILSCVLFVAPLAHALTAVSVDACLAKKLTSSGKGTAAYLKCQAKAAKKSTSVDSLCVTVAGSKLEVAFAKQDSKGECAITGDGPARNDDASGYAEDVASAVGTAGACDAAKLEHVGTFVQARMECYAKAADKTGSVDPTCLDKAAAKLADRIAKAEAKPGCSQADQGAELRADAIAFADGQACALDPANSACFPTPTPQPTPTVTANPTPGVCGDGFNSPDELCDASAPSGGWTGCGPDFTCVDCNCACPTRLRFAPDAADPRTLLDRGWNGVAHAQPITTGGEVTYAVACDGDRTAVRELRPEWPDRQHAARRAPQSALQRRPFRSRARALRAASSDCGGPLGTCEFYLGPPLSLSAGGVGTCVLNQFAGPVTGTADIESGAMATDADGTRRRSAAPSVDRPCPICITDTTANDGVSDGHLRRRGAERARVRRQRHRAGPAGLRGDQSRLSARAR